MHATALHTAKENAETLVKVADNVAALTKAVESFGSAVKESSKQARLEWALINASIGSFHFQDPRGDHLNSRDEVVTILCQFKRGFGSYISEGYLMGSFSPVKSSYRVRLVSL